MQDITPRLNFIYLLQNNRPRAIAWVRGNMHPHRPSGFKGPGTMPSPAQTSPSSISGLVKFYDTNYGGVLVEAEIFGLPDLSAPLPPTSTHSTFTRSATVLKDSPKPEITIIPPWRSIRTMLVTCPHCWAIKAMPGLPSLTGGLPSMKS